MLRAHYTAVKRETRPHTIRAKGRVAIATLGQGNIFGKKIKEWKKNKIAVVVQLMSACVRL